MCTRDWLADWKHVRFDKLREAGFDFYVILPVPHWALAKYVRGEGASLPHEVKARLYCDPDAAAFDALGFNFKFDSRSTFTSIHAKTTVFQATVRGFVLGVTGGGMQGDPRQQGGAFVLERRANAAAAGGAGAGKGGGEGELACVWAHYDRHNADQVPIPVFLRAAGAPVDAYVHVRDAS
jgi:hypothetical protein